MDWRRLVTDDANETDLLRSYVVRVTDATFGYMRWSRLSEQISRVDKWSVCRS